VPYYKSLEEKIDTEKKSNGFIFPHPYEPEYEPEINELLNKNETGIENNNEEIQEEESDEGGIEPMELRRSARTPHPSTRLHDYIPSKKFYLTKYYNRI
jgi:hypothetical protein